MAYRGDNHKGGQKKGNLRPKISHYWSEDDIKDYFAWLKESYKENPTLAKFVGEQLMGKAPQPLWHGDSEGEKIVFVPEQILKKHGIGTEKGGG